MTTVDCAIFNLFEHGHSVVHAVPFADEWADFSFTRTESNSSVQAPLHLVSVENQFQQNNFDNLRLCSQAKPQPVDSQMDQFKYNFNSSARPKEMYQFHTVAPQKEMYTIPLFGSDVPQGQQIRAEDASKGALCPATPTHASTWEFEPYAAHQPAHQVAATCSAETSPAPAPAARSPAQQPASPTQQKGSKPRARQNKKPVFWTNDEHEKFLSALRRFNGDEIDGLGAGVAELISMALGSRTVSQVRSHAQKYFLRLRQQ